MEEEGGENKNEQHVYKECQRNYAASLGSYATDGCGEFTLDHTSNNSTLQCAACGCHRSFHRKVMLNRRRQEVAVEEERSSGINNNNNNNKSRRKRLRTKFTADQKEKMLAFAEKLSWKLQRKYNNEEEDEVERFCRGIAITRHVFKIWMHNHKHSNSSLSISNYKN